MPPAGLGPLWLRKRTFPIFELLRVCHQAAQLASSRGIGSDRVGVVNVRHGGGRGGFVPPRGATHWELGAAEALSNVVHRSSHRRCISSRHVRQIRCDIRVPKVEARH